MTLLRPRLRLPDIEDWVNNAISLLTRQERGGKARFVSRLLHLSFFMERLHKNPPFTSAFEGIPQYRWFSFSSAFSSRMLRTGLGGAHADYQKYLHPFWIFEDGNEGYSKKGKITKAYLLKNSALDSLNNQWSGSSTAEIVDRDTGDALSRKDFPNNGICRSYRSSITIRSIIPYPIDKIDTLIAKEEAEQADVHGSGLPFHLRRRRVRALRYFYQARHWIRLLDGMPNLYADYFEDDHTALNGRLWGIGGFSLQRLPRDARSLLYSGTGWTDFDFISCHGSILHSLARAYGLETPFFDDYMASREEINDLIAQDINISTGKMKRVMNATIYGQPLSKSPHMSLLSTIGGAAIDALTNHLYYRMMRDEIINVIRPVVILNHVRGDVVVNAAGKERKVVEKDSRNGQTKAVPPRKLLSHILTGYEAWALDRVCRNTKDLIALMGG